MKTHMVAHHGSPGHPDDFKELIQLLGPDYEIELPCRWNTQQTMPKAPAKLSLGWSFGAVYALEDLEYGRAESALLLCPWLWTKSSPSPMWLRTLALFMGPLLLSKHTRECLPGHSDLVQLARKRWSGKALFHALGEKTHRKTDPWELLVKHQERVHILLAQDDPMLERLSPQEKALFEQAKWIPGAHGALISHAKSIVPHLLQVLTTPNPRESNA